MGKGRYFGMVAVAAALVVSGWGGSGCGQSNDQGISFRALGFFEDSAGSTGDTGQVEPLACTDFLLSSIGLENNMLQGIQIERADLTFRVSASSLQIPNHSEAISQRLGPATGQENSPPRKFIEIFVVPANIIEFLNNNRNQLPPLPFEMVVTATASGIADSGDHFRTNRIGYQVTWLEDDECESEESGEE